jgi:predicted nucleic acid-binding protein
MRKIFLDSSVLIAGAAARTGASRAVLTLAEVGLFQVVVAEQVLQECQRNLTKKLPAALPVFNQLIAALKPVVQPMPSQDEMRPWLEVIEAKDAPILAAAMLAGSDRLLSLNTKDFTPAVAERAGLVIQTPAQFIEDLRAIVQRALQ